MRYFILKYLALQSIRFTPQASSPPTCSRLYLLSSTQKLRFPLPPAALGLNSLCFHHHARALRARITTIMHTWISLAGSQVTLTFCFLTQVFPNVTLIFTKTLLLNEDPSIHTV